MYSLTLTQTGVEFNASYGLLDAVFTANHLTDTDKQNSTRKYT